MPDFLNLLWLTLLFFLPAFLGNGAPVVAAKIKYFNFLDGRIDGGRVWRGKAVLGRNKTWRGVVAAMLGGALGGLLTGFMTVENFIPVWDFWIVFGVVMGLGAITGDALKSFVKRRVGIEAGQPWIVFDQIDFVVVAWLSSFIFYGFWSHWQYFLMALLIAPPIHFASNWIVYKIGLKKVWW